MIKEAQSLLQHCVVKPARRCQKDFVKHRRFAVKQVPPHFQEALRRGLEHSYGSSLTLLKDAAVRCKETTPSRRNQRNPAKARTTFQSPSAMAATASGSGDDLRSTGQQSPLASQRAKQNDAPSEANRTGKFGRYFTLGYKEGFNQWVHSKQLPPFPEVETNELVVGKCASSGRRACCHVIRSIPQAASHSYPNRHTTPISHWFNHVHIR